MTWDSSKCFYTNWITFRAVSAALCFMYNLVDRIQFIFCVLYSITDLNDTIKIPLIPSRNLRNFSHYFLVAFLISQSR